MLIYMLLRKLAILAYLRPKLQVGEFHAILREDFVIKKSFPVLL